MKKICTLSPLHHSCILILGPSKLHRASRKNPHRSKIWEVYTIYWFEYIQSAQKFVISWRTKQKWCSLNKIQVLVRSYFFTEVNIHDKLYIKKDTTIWENSEENVYWREFMDSLNSNFNRGIWWSRESITRIGVMRIKLSGSWLN